MSVRKAVVGIIFLKETPLKFLVLHRKLGWEGWEFPKGGVERGDNGIEEAALKREIAEETGLTDVRILSKVPFEIRYDYPAEYRNRYRHEGTAQSVFLVRSFSSGVELSAEHDGFLWLPFEKALEKLTFADQKKVMEAAREELGKLDCS